jgi:cell division protein FtsZ
VGGPAPSSDAIESAAKAAVAAAVLPLGGTEDVTIRPMTPKPPMLLEPASDDTEEELPPEEAFIPPPPERTARVGRPMPRLEDLPIPGQNELRAVRGEASGADLPEKRRMGLLQRLASVGLGRRDMPGEGESPVEIHRPAQLEPPRPSNRPGAGRDWRRIRPPNTVKSMAIRDLIRLDDKLLCIIRLRTTSLKSRHSCAGRRRKPCPPAIRTLEFTLRGCVAGGRIRVREDCITC